MRERYGARRGRYVLCQQTRYFSWLELEGKKCDVGQMEDRGLYAKSRKHKGMIRDAFQNFDITRKR